MPKKPANPETPKKKAAGSSKTMSDNASDSFCVVALGASAGGLEAYLRFFRALPADTGLAFVVIQHLSATQESSLADILSRATTMPVIEVKDEPRVEGNHVYVIPPAKTMSISNRTLQLQQREPRTIPHPIDLFFKALAQDQSHSSIGIVFSGTGNDGTAGLREIKEAGGVTFAQDETAAYDSMPRSAVAAGCVDFILPPESIAQEIARIASHPYLAPSTFDRPGDEGSEDSLRLVTRELHRINHVDFGHYKPTTIRRRIARRMMLHQIDSMPQYAQMLRERPDEASTLFQDLLIGVTSFFRDPEIFEVLKREVFPNLLRRRHIDDPLRIWIPGCSTGEEAYSYAIAAAECMEEAGLSVPIQLFASDLNGGSVDKARAGLYPKSIAQDMSPARLRANFVELDGSYRISKAIRETCIFAVHNVLRDPPFSKVDLISCRNLLIYLESAAQKKLLSQLHYSLKSGGYLVVGTSENIGSLRTLFESSDSKSKIFRKLAGAARLATNSPALPAAAHDAPPKIDIDPTIPKLDASKEADRILLSKFAPAAVLIDASLEIQQFRGDTSPYLIPASGKASLNLLKMARGALVIPLRAATHRAKHEMTPVRDERLRLNIDGVQREINLEVIPVQGATEQECQFLVLMEDAQSQHAPLRKAATGEKKARKSAPSTKASAKEEIARLAQELAASREYLQSIIEQQDMTNEELHSANEEAQSSNEELQSINEELETSKEEIQSTNEELQTVNDELQHRNQDLNRLNNDLVNLLSSMDTAIVMVGRDLRIRRFTPLAARIFHLIPGDVGRPLTDIKVRLSLPNLDDLLIEVIDTVSSRDREIQDEGGRWYRLRLRPYKTLDGHIDGAVLVLVDIDTMKRARELSEGIVATVREPLVVLDRELRVRSASKSFYERFEVAPEQVRNQLLFELGTGELNIPILRKKLGDIVDGRAGFEDLELEIPLTSTESTLIIVNARHIFQSPGSDPLILLSLEIVTHRKQFHQSLRQVAQLSELDRSKNEFLAMLAHELRNPLAPLQNALHLMRSPSADDDKRAQAYEVMERQLTVMTRLVDDLLDSARITQRKIGLFRQTIELTSLLRRVTQTAKVNTDRQRQVLEVSLPQGPVYVDGDETRLEQAFSNLLNNAAKFTQPEGLIAVTAELSNRTVEGNGGGEVVIRLRDNGQGISPASLPYIFDLFMQSDRSLDRPQGGLGIGLTLTRKLLELHGGSIEAYSEGLGLGSEFVIRLPVLASAEVGSESALVISHASAQDSKKILVVDDNVDAADSLAMILSLAGHQSLTAHTAEAGLRKAVENLPDVIILDIGMPEMDGYQLAGKIREHPALADVLLIALSGYGREEDRNRSRDAGIDLHFTKPADLATLQDAFNSALRARFS